MELRWPAWFGRRGASVSRLGASGFANSTLAEMAWQRARRASMRWGVWGAAVGAVIALVSVGGHKRGARLMRRRLDQADAGEGGQVLRIRPRSS